MGSTSPVSRPWALKAQIASTGRASRLPTNHLQVEQNSHSHTLVTVQTLPILCQKRGPGQLTSLPSNPLPSSVRDRLLAETLFLFPPDVPLPIWGRCPDSQRQKEAGSGLLQRPTHVYRAPSQPSESSSPLPCFLLFSPAPAQPPRLAK